MFNSTASTFVDANYIENKTVCKIFLQTFCKVANAVEKKAVVDIMITVILQPTWLST